MTCTSSYSIYAIVHDFSELQHVLDRLYKCPDGVKCQAVQTAAFAQFRENVLLKALQDQVFLSDTLVQHSNGVFVVSTRNICAGIDLEIASTGQKRSRSHT